MAGASLSIADDWSVRRSPFNPQIVARYKALLKQRPNDGYAMGKLVSMYRKHKSLAVLLGEYQKLASGEPGSYAYQVILGHLYRRLDRTEEAVAHYKRAGKLNPKTPTVPAALGGLYHKQGHTQEAIEAYRKALSLSTSVRLKKRYLRSLASIALTAKDMTAARQYYDQLVGLEPKNLLLRMELAQALARSGHESKAIEQYRTILQRSRDSGTKADVLKEIGALQYGLGKSDEAVATYRKAMGLTSRTHWLRRELTNRIISIYRKKEDLKSLIEYYEKSWKRRGHFEHEILGRLYDETGDELKALKAYQSALKSTPHAVDTRVRLIALLERGGQVAEVIRQYRRLAKLAPGDPKHQIELAKRLYRSGKQKEALRVLQQCGRRFVGDASVHSALADLYARWGKQQLAMRSAQTLVHIEPKDPSHLINLGEQYYARNQKRKAFETWKRLLHVIPKRHAALAKLAEIYGQHDKIKEAIRLFRKAIKLQPKHLPYRQGLALFLQRQRYTTKALEAWNQVLELARAEHNSTVQRDARSHIIDILHRSYLLPAKIRTFRMDFEGPSPKADAGFILAEAYLKLGQPEKAASVYQRILTLEKNNLEAMAALTTVYRRQRKLTEAVKLLKRLAELQPHMARDYYQRIAELLLQLYNDQEALIYAHKAVALGAQDARSYERLGALYEKKEDYNGAIKAYRTAIRLAPNRFSVHFTLARLLTQQGRYPAADALYRQVITGAKAPEIIRKAFRLSLDLSGYLGTLQSLEKAILPLSVTSSNAEAYRRMLVKIYRRRIPPLIDRARRGDPKMRRKARQELSRIGNRGLTPLLEELATTSSPQKELIRFLGYLGNSNAIPALLRVAEREPDEEVTVIHASARPGFPPIGGSYGYTSGHSGFINRLTAKINLRVEAIVAMGRIAHERALGELIKLLNNREGHIREAAAWSLSRIPHRASSRALFDALGDLRPSVQMMACAGLGIAGEASIRPVLEEVMLDDDRQDIVRAACAWGLGVLGSSRAVPALVRAIQKGDDSLQRSAVWSLGMLADSRPLPHLVRSLWNKRLAVRQAAIWSLSRIASGETPRRRLRTPDVVVNGGKLDTNLFLKRLTREVDDLGDPTLAKGLTDIVIHHRAAIKQGLQAALQRHRDVVLRVLEDLDGDRDRLTLGPLTKGRYLRNDAHQAELDKSVTAICHHVAEQLAHLLTHRDPLIRQGALSVYIKLAPADAEDRIRRSLRDPLWSVRAQALQTIAVAHRRGAISTKQAADLVQGQLSAKHWRERETAISVAGQLGQRRLSVPLAASAQDPNGFVRQAAVLALGRTGGQEAARAVIQALKDDIPHVREAACLSLIELKHRPALPHLRQLSKDPSPRVRRAAKTAIHKLR